MHANNKIFKMANTSSKEMSTFRPVDWMSTLYFIYQLSTFRPKKCDTLGVHMSTLIGCRLSVRVDFPSDSRTEDRVGLKIATQLRPTSGLLEYQIFLDRRSPFANNVYSPGWRGWGKIRVWGSSPLYTRHRVGLLGQANQLISPHARTTWSHVMLLR